MDGSYLCLPAYQLPRLQPRPPRPPPSLDLPQQAPAAHGGSDAYSGNDDRNHKCIALSTVRGYVLVSQGSHLSVYNTTENAQLLFTTPTATAVDNFSETGCGGVSLVPRWAALSISSSGEALIAEATSCASTVS